MHNKSSFCKNISISFFKDGSRWGSIDSSGSIYASDGTYLGSLDKFGKFHDSSGTYMGSIDSQGKIRNYKGERENCASRMSFSSVSPFWKPTFLMFLIPFTVSSRGPVPAKKKIEKLWGDKKLCAEYSANCKDISFDTIDEYYEKIMKVYR